MKHEEQKTLKWHACSRALMAYVETRRREKKKSTKWT